MHLIEYATALQPRNVATPKRLDFQEFMIAPIGAPSLAEAMPAGADVYAALRAPAMPSARPVG